MKREYTIGEVAEILQVSRDTLRFYEKKKLITPVKKENGYRYYSDEHIGNLLDILFLRKIQCSLQDIQAIYEDGSPEQLNQFLKLRVQEEEKHIKMHQQLLRQLMVSQHSSEKMMENINQYSIRSIPRTYIFSDIMNDFDQIREEWFHAAETVPELAHCYLHEQFLPGTEGGRTHRCYLVLEEFAVKKMGLEAEAKKRPSFQLDRCVYTVYASETVSPDEQAIGRMQNWAKGQGVELTGEIHAHYLWNYRNSGNRDKFYIELYMPVKQ